MVDMAEKRGFFRRIIDAIFNRKASSAGAGGAVLFGLSDTGHKSDYKSIADEGYKQNPDVFACLSEIAGAVAGIPWKLYRRRGDGLEEVKDHPLIDLLARPNPLDSWEDFIEAWTTYLYLAGQAFVYRAGPVNGLPRELWNLSPRYVSVVPGGRFQPVAGYDYQPDRTKPPTRLKPEEVMHTKFFNPLDPLNGLSPLVAAYYEIDQGNHGRKWNVSLLRNGARPMGMFVMPEGMENPTPEQQEAVRRKLLERFQGYEHAGEPIIVAPGTEWKDIGKTPRDMDWTAAMNLSTEKICAVLKVPPEIIGNPEKRTYNSFPEARKAFYMECILPLMDKIQGNLNYWLVPQFGDDLVLRYDRGDIEALQEGKTEVYKRVQDAWWLSLNEKRRETGFDEINAPWADDIYVPATLVPIGSTKEGKQSGPFAVKRTAAVGLETEDAKAAYWKSFDRYRERFYETFTRVIAKQFEEERDAVIEEMRTGVTPDSAIGRAMTAVDAQRDEWRKVYDRLYTSVAIAFAEPVYDAFKAQAGGAEMKQEDVLDIWGDAARAYVGSIFDEKWAAVSATTKRILREQLAEGLTQGEGFDGLERRISNVYTNDFAASTGRARRIARTEVIAASNLGSRVGAKATGLPMEKEWIATRDDRTRDDHANADGQRRKLDDPYVVGGEQLMFPGDASLGARASNIVNCRCVEGYHVVR